MLEKARQLVTWIEQMDRSGFYFSNDTKRDFEDLYTVIMWENRFPPQMYPEGVPAGTVLHTLDGPGEAFDR